MSSPAVQALPAAATVVPLAIPVRTRYQAHALQAHAAFHKPIALLHRTAAMIHATQENAPQAAQMTAPSRIAATQPSQKAATPG